MDKIKAKKQIIQNLEKQGFKLDTSCEIIECDSYQKDTIRSLHNHFREEKLKAESNFWFIRLKRTWFHVRPEF